MIFKYIITNTGAILFNENTTHLAVGYGFQQLEKETSVKKLYSAGFAKIELEDKGGRIECYGESTSLKIKSNPKVDAMIIADLFRDVSEIKYFGKKIEDFEKEADKPQFKKS